MTSVIERRTSIHRQLAGQQEQLRSLRAQVERLEGLANLGTATAMIAHELNNLLTPLANYADVALSNRADSELVEKALRRTAANCKQAAKVMEGILSLAAGKAAQKVSIPLLPLVQGTFECLCRDFAKDGITVRIEIAEDLAVWAVPAQLQQVLMNLLLNARQAMLGRGGILTVAAKESQDAVAISVSDTGHGMSADEMKNIFQIFFTTKSNAGTDERPGYGLGLAFCRKIIDAHNGTIEVESQPGSGTTFRILLPKLC